MNKPKASIIIVNYNGLKSMGTLLFKCIDSAFNLDYPNYEVIIVDNASTDGSREEITNRYHGDAKILLLNHNLGFAAANNLALRKADPKSKYIVLMNPDLKAYPDSLKTMIKHMEQDPTIGELQGIVLWMKNPKRIENAGAFVDHFCYVITRYHMELLNEYLDQETYVSYTSGAYTIIRRKALRGDQLFPPHFFLYYEDVELGLRLWTHAYKAKVIPQPTAEHHLGAITKGSKNPLVLYCDTRNRLTLIKTIWTQYPQLGKLLPFTLLRNALKIYKKFYSRGFLDGLLGCANHVLPKHEWGRYSPLILVPRAKFSRAPALIMGRASYNVLRKSFIGAYELKNSGTPFLVEF